MSSAPDLRAGDRDPHLALVQLLALCPLLALSTSMGRGLGLGVATLTLLVASNGLVALLARMEAAAARMAACLLLLAALVVALEREFAAWLPGLPGAQGAFLLLIVTNYLVLAPVAETDSRRSLGLALREGCVTGGGFLLLLVAMGSLRELLGSGRLGADVHALLGTGTATAGMRVFAGEHGFLLVLLPPGAFILLGLALAWWQARAQAAARASTAADTRSHGSPA